MVGDTCAECDECGYDYDAVPRDALPDEIRRLAAALAERIAGTDASALRAHPRPDAWSALEYACHLRDVLRVQRERIVLALAETEPTFALMRRDERVTEDRYNEQDPAVVATELVEAARAVAAQLESLGDSQWQRTGVYPYPEPQIRTLEWVARHTVHEAVHHSLDVDRLLRA
jgi:hypothetical protein